jgi:hypothetical protein
MKTEHYMNNQSCCCALRALLINFLNNSFAANYMKQSPFLEDNSCSASQKSESSFGTERFIIVLQSARHWNLY